MTNAIDFFAASLRFQTDVTDTAAAIEADTVVVVDSRSRASWDQGHIPGALHLPTAEIARRALDELDPSTTVVTYCWGPGCNGATRAALEFAKLGFEVKEMIGGFEYWAREGLPIQTSTGIGSRTPDPLTVPIATLACGC